MSTEDDRDQKKDDPTEDKTGVNDEPEKPIDLTEIVQEQYNPQSKKYPPKKE